MTEHRAVTAAQASAALYLRDQYRAEYKRVADLVFWIDDVLLDIARINPYAGETLFATQRRLNKKLNRLAMMVVQLEEYARCDGQSSSASRSSSP